MFRGLGLMPILMIDKKLFTNKKNEILHILMWLVYASCINPENTKVFVNPTCLGLLLPI